MSCSKTTHASEELDREGEEQRRALSSCHDARADELQQHGLAPWEELVRGGDENRRTWWRLMAATAAATSFSSRPSTLARKGEGMGPNPDGASLGLGATLEEQGQRRVNVTTCPGKYRTIT
jgi:hypothetical protein